MDGDDSQRSIEHEARRRVSDGCAYRFEFRHISFSFNEGVLKVQGRVPSFHLKQVLQTRLAGIEGVERLDDQVDVTSR